MSIEMTDNEARVIGCLLEKSAVTPDQYPLTLNALTNACNQKSARDPVMNLDPGVVQHTVRTLQEKHLIRVEENFKTQKEKYTQRLCNTPFSDYQFNPAEYASVCVLLLRGARTPGEIRANSGRLHEFSDNSAVVEALTSLIDRTEGPVVVELPRTPGRKDPEYMHLLCGPVEFAAADTHPAVDQQRRAARQPGLEERVSTMEAELAELRILLENALQHR